MTQSRPKGYFNNWLLSRLNRKAAATDKMRTPPFWFNGLNTQQIDPPLQPPSLKRGGNDETEVQSLIPEAYNPIL
jgi:hypothetical protein